MATKEIPIIGAITVFVQLLGLKIGIMIKNQ